MLLGEGYHVVEQVARQQDGGGASIASRWPVRDHMELDLRSTPVARIDDYAATALIAEIDAPPPIGPLLFINHCPSWQPRAEYDRERQALVVARAVEQRVGDRNRHVIIGGDFNADPESASVRFWSGRQSLDGTSVCYRDAWAAIHPGEPGGTFVPGTNPLVADRDWPFRRIDYVFVRCGDHDGPTLAIHSCERIFDQPRNGAWGSDHFGVTADLVQADSG